MRPLTALPLFGHASGDRNAAFRAPPIVPVPVPYAPHGPGFKGERGNPGEDAAKAISSTTSLMRSRVMRELRDAEAEEGPAFPGLVSDDVAQRLGEHALNVQPRISELYKLGLVEKSGRGKSVLGNPATRWRLKRGGA